MAELERDDNSILRLYRNLIQLRQMHPVLVNGKLAKDDGTVNVLAEEVLGLQSDIRQSEPGRPAAHAFSFLRAMRRVAPDSKDWG